jgi:hypothetical protein
MLIEIHIVPTLPESGVKRRRFDRMQAALKKELREFGRPPITDFRD